MVNATPSPHRHGRLWIRFPPGARMRLATPVGRAVAVDAVGLLREQAILRGEGKWVIDAIWTQSGF